MSYNTELQSNNTELQEILDAVNALPEAGGGAEEAVAALMTNSVTNLDNSMAASVKAYTFREATNLLSVNLPAVTTVGTYVFYGCTNLLTVSLPAVSSINSSAFEGCTKLKKADLGAPLSFSSYVFRNCSALETLILRNPTKICNLLSTAAFTSSGVAAGTGYIYVPATLIETYKTATNWSAHAAQFRAIEDYPDITGG